MTLSENILFIIITIAIITVAIYSIYKFISKPSKKQITRLKEWLLWAVAYAEKELGEGTGQLKLRFVYDLFISEFMFLAHFLTFEKFSEYVDEALEKFEILLKTNSKVSDYIKK